MLDAAIWQELCEETAHVAEAVYHTAGTLLYRWLLARAEYPEMEAIKLFAKVRAYVAQPDISCNRAFEDHESQFERV